MVLSLIAVRIAPDELAGLAKVRLREKREAPVKTLKGGRRTTVLFSLRCCGSLDEKAQDKELASRRGSRKV